MRIAPGNLMKKFLIKTIAVLITGSLLGGSLFYFWKNKYAFSKNKIGAEEKASDKTGKAEAKKEENDKKIPDGKAEIIGYIEKNITKISPQKPLSGLAWKAVKIWFIDDKNFYVDYKDGALNIRRVLVNQSTGGPGAEYEVLGFFVPGESGWTLKSGKDIAGSSFPKLYEKNEQNDEWTVR